MRISRFGNVLLGIFVGAFFGAFALSLVQAPVLSSVGSGGELAVQYDAQVCVYKTPWLGNRYGETQLVDCSHNVLYSNGQNMTRDLLTQFNGNPIKNISLCNASAACGTPVAAASESYTTFANCGLASVNTTTFNIVPTSNGNWSITNTFTSTCDGVNTTATRLLNVTNSLFAGNAFTLVTLQTNDQLTVNWTISVV